MLAFSIRPLPVRDVTVLTLTIIADMVHTGKTFPHASLELEPRVERETGSPGKFMQYFKWSEWLADKVVLAPVQLMTARLSFLVD